MSFINVLKRPFEYDENLDKNNIVDSLITIGISVAICIITIILAVVIITNKTIRTAEGMFGGFGSLSDSISGKAIFTIFYSSILGYIVGILVITALLFAIRRIGDKRTTFVQSVSLVSSALVLPSVIAPLALVGVIFINSFGIWISGVVIIVSFILLLINLFEGLKAVGGVGIGRSIYLVSTATILYYGLTIYITTKIATQAIVSSIYSIF